MLFRLFRKNKIRGSKYCKWRVKEVIQETDDAISIVFNTSNELIPYRSGQFITLILSIEGKKVHRSYSLCSSPFMDKHLAVTVKRAPHGLGSNYLVDTLKSGNTLKLIPPAGKFVVDYDKEAKHHFVMFAGGVGITPLISILKSVLLQEPDSVISLLYCNRDLQSIIFKQELDRLEKAYRGRLRVLYALDEAPTDWNGYTGMLDQAMASAFIADTPVLEEYDPLYMICGPKGMMIVLDSFLDSQGVPPHKIKKELFKSISHPQSSDEQTKKRVTTSTARVVTVIHDDTEYKLKVKPGNAILETALDQGIDLPFSCQSGVCTACRGKALSGKVDLHEATGLSQEELQEGYVLTCVGRPLTDDVVIEIG